MAPGGRRQEQTVFLTILTKSSSNAFINPFTSKLFQGAASGRGPSDNTRMGAASPPAPRRLLGFRPRELRPAARSAMRAQPNSAVLEKRERFSGRPNFAYPRALCERGPGRRGASFQPSQLAARGLQPHAAKKQ